MSTQNGMEWPVRILVFKTAMKINNISTGIYLISSWTTSILASAGVASGCDRRKSFGYGMAKFSNYVLHTYRNENPSQRCTQPNELLKGENPKIGKNKYTFSYIIWFRERVFISYSFKNCFTWINELGSLMEWEKSDGKNLVVLNLFLWWLVFCRI